MGVEAFNHNIAKSVRYPHIVHRNIKASITFDYADHRWLSQDLPIFKTNTQIFY